MGFISCRTLLDGVTYTVTFDVWPSQYTYDLVSDIKNGLVDYDDDEQVDPNIKKYLRCVNKVCTLYTNTYADLTYTDTDVEEGVTPEPTTIPFTDEIDPVRTDASQMTVKKIWDNKLGDNHGSSEYPQVTFKVIKDNNQETPYDTKILYRNNGWTDKVFIAPGLIQTKQINGVTKSVIREPGHDYTFNEDPEELNHHWDLQVETVRPMVIDGVLTTLVKVEENVPTIDDTNKLVDNGVTYYKINGNVYFVREENAAYMQATNVRRSNLNITKEVTGEAPEDAEFTFKLKVKDALDGNLWFSIYDPATGTVMDDKYVTVENAAVFNKEYNDDNEFVGFYEVSSNADITVTMKANRT